MFRFKPVRGEMVMKWGQCANNQKTKFLGTRCACPESTWIRGPEIGSSLRREGGRRLWRIGPRLVSLTRQLPELGIAADEHGTAADRGGGEDGVVELDRLDDFAFFGGGVDDLELAALVGDVDVIAGKGVSVQIIDVSSNGLRCGCNEFGLQPWFAGWARPV